MTEHKVVRLGRTRKYEIPCVVCLLKIFEADWELLFMYTEKVEGEVPGFQELRLDTALMAQAVAALQTAFVDGGPSPNTTTLVLRRKTHG